MSTSKGGAHSAKEAEDPEDSPRALYEKAKSEAERDAHVLLKACAGRRVDLIHAAARAASLSAGRLAGFAANLGATLLLIS